MSDPSSSERPPAPGLTRGDPLQGAGASPPSPRPAPEAPPPPPLGSAPEAPPPALYGYTTPPPPGAGGAAPGPYGFAPGSLRLSGWWRRVGAQVLDAVIVGAVAAVLLVPLGIGAATVDSDSGVAALIGAAVVTLLVYLVLAMLYAPLMMSRTNGQTLGRMAMDIRVVRANGQPMTFGFAALREIGVKGLLVGLAGSVTFGLASLVDNLWPLWDEQHRALHDMVVNTRVVRA